MTGCYIIQQSLFHSDSASFAQSETSAAKYFQAKELKNGQGWREGTRGLEVTGSHILHLSWSWFLAVGEVSAFLSLQLLFITSPDPQGSPDLLLSHTALCCNMQEPGL